MENSKILCNYYYIQLYFFKNHYLLEKNGNNEKKNSGRLKIKIVNYIKLIL